MTTRITSAAIIAAGLLWWSGCERSPSTDEAKPAEANPAQAPSPGTNARGMGPEMVRLPGGRFQMGDKGQPDAKPHMVEVSPFFMDSTLVTQAQYQKVMGANPARWKGNNNPVEQVRWSDAVKYCNKR
jgi:formylglycine-generating enzyme required for sulfatase activity